VPCRFTLDSAGLVFPLTCFIVPHKRNGQESDL
jgi:hypothetical protein